MPLTQDRCSMMTFLVEGAMQWAASSAMNLLRFRLLDENGLADALLVACQVALRLPVRSSAVDVDEHERDEHHSADGAQSVHGVVLVIHVTSIQDETRFRRLFRLHCGYE